MSLLTAKFWNLFGKWLSLICILPIFLSIGFGLHSYSFLKSAKVAEAKIIELIPRESDGSTLFAPVYIFKDSGGNEIKKYSNTASYPPIGNVGDLVDILYSPEDSNKSRMNTFFSKWGISSILGGLGLFYLVACLIVIYFTGRRIRKKESDPDGVINSESLRSSP
jgi:hypothetical protein